MKKLKFIVMLLLSAMLVMVAVACNDTVTLESITIKQGTIASVVEQGDTLDTSKVIILAHYSDGSEKEIGAKDDGVTFSNFSTAELGEFELTVEYKGLICKTVIKVKEKDVYASYEIVGVNLPDFVSDYRNACAEKTDKRTEFSVRDDVYYVGDDNEFKFKPTVLVSNGEFDVDIGGEMLDADVKVEIKNEGSYEEVKAEDYVEVKAYGSYLFSETAIDKTIRFTVTPFIVDHPDSASDSVSFEFKVVDGWNAYNAVDLAMIEADRLVIEDNEQNRNSAAGWVEFKEAHGLPVDHKANAVIMHSNIKITKDDIPSIFFYGQNDVAEGDADYARVVGSLKDYYEIYQHNVLPGEHFELIGNYFTMNAEELPLVVREGWPGTIKDVGTVISHATLIKFRGKNRDINDSTPNGSAVMKNIYFVGNSNRSDEGEGKLSGGLINHKIRGIDFAIENCISVKWFISYFPESYEDVTAYDINNCKAYDNYNCFLYVWGGGNYEDQKFINVKNSEMIGAGGPVMICDHCNSKRQDGGFPSNVKVTNCNLESFVTGQEGWFNLVGAGSLATKVKAINQMFVLNGRTFLKHNAVSNNDEFNFIAVFKANNDNESLLNFSPIKGYLQIDENAALDFGQGTPVIDGLLKFHGEQKTGAPIFQSAKGGAAYFGGEGFFDANKQPITKDDLLFQGDYLNAYVGAEGMTGFIGVMFGYYTVEQ